MKFIKNPKHSYLSLSNCIRILASDSVEKAESGHPGMVLGMADVMTVLAFDFLKYNPKDPKWFNRDRLVLSAGHGSMLLYAFYYLAGFTNFTLNDLMQFRQLYSKTPGHPEYGSYPAIETTTGPLGQGLAASVGMAIGAKKYQQKLGNEGADYKIYCVVGDGCLMEGISYEAASLAGHLRLNNLIVLFDDNQISIDGPTSLAVSEDHIAKFLSLGWNTQQIDGHDFTQINAALERAQNSDKPYFISCKTQIGKGSEHKAGTENAHGSPLGQTEISYMKKNMGTREEAFFIPEAAKELWEQAWERNIEKIEQWQKIYYYFSQEQKDYLAAPIISSDIFANIVVPSKPEATRASSGQIIQLLLEGSEKVVCGSADLSISTNVKNNLSKPIIAEDFSGNYIHYGVRENAMAAIMNGLAISGFLPIGGTFFVFSDYMRPGIRLSALMGVKVIYVMTHDSIGVGEDGPTHQPVEHLASLRAMPNLLVLRPADFIETLECWRIALAHDTGPSMLVLTRQAVPQLRADNYCPEENLSARGAYIVIPALAGIHKSDVTIFASGSELSVAMAVGDILQQQDLIIEIISIPCFELFFQQNQDYINSILHRSKLKVAIEAATSFGWHRIIGDNGMFFGVEEFGQSAPAARLYEYFGLTPKSIADKIKVRVKSILS